MKNIVLLFILSFLSLSVKAQKLDDVRLEEYRKLTEDRVTDFQAYLSIISNKSLPMEERREAIEQAKSLFCEDAKMKVTGKNNTSKRVTIGGYLNSLISLGSYNKVEVTNYHVIQISSPIMKDNDLKILFSTMDVRETASALAN